MSNAREITLRGIVVGNRAAGEGNLRVLMYTDGLGLVPALATSAREERSQLRAHLQEGTIGVFTLVSGRDFWRVTGGVDTTSIYFRADTSTSTKESASRVMGVVRQFVHGEGGDQYLFDVLWNFFTTIAHLEENTLEHAECLTILRILYALGYVERSHDIQTLLDVSYSAGTLESVAARRDSLIHTINEGINASGL